MKTAIYIIDLVYWILYIIRWASAGAMEVVNAVGEVLRLISEREK